MNLRLKRQIRSLVGFFALGLGTDIGVVLWYRSVSGGMVLLAMLLSFLVTLIPFFVIWKGIETKALMFFVSYALGASVGTFVAMMVRF